MLAMSDTNIDQFLPVFAETGVSVAFLVPTPTGYEKSIMDAISPVRELLKNEHIHSYEQQKQGPAYKHMVQSFFVTADGMIETEASLYRPVTKNGDPRIWFKNLKKHCRPCNLLALTVFDGSIYVMNLSNEAVRLSLLSNGFVSDFLHQIKQSKESVANELLRKILAIHNEGFIPSITPGDPGVGDTLEHALGIERNNSPTPDYKGIELKSTRLTRHGNKRATTRTTLFARVPDEGLTYRQIVESYGKWQTPRDSEEERFQLYETFTTKRVNGYDLTLDVNYAKDRLEIQYVSDITRKYVSSWKMENLKTALLTKHHETFWVKAISKDIDGHEYFRYDQVLHTKQPNTTLLAPLLDEGIITVDLAAHFKKDGKWRDHGALFKIFPNNISLLLGEATEYDLTKMKNN